jgi:hypothetical protein
MVRIPDGFTGDKNFNVSICDTHDESGGNTGNLGSSRRLKISVYDSAGHARPKEPDCRIPNCGFKLPHYRNLGTRYNRACGSCIFYGMKIARRTTTLALFTSALLFAPALTQAQDNNSASQDVKTAGHDTKDAAKSTGHAVAKGTKTTAHATKTGTVKGYDKSKETGTKGDDKSKEGTEKVADKTKEGTEHVLAKKKEPASKAKDKAHETSTADKDKAKETDQKAHDDTHPQ